MTRNISRRDLFRGLCGFGLVAALKPVEALAGPPAPTVIEKPVVVERVVEVIKEYPMGPKIIIEEDGAVLSEHTESCGKACARTEEDTIYSGVKSEGARR